MKIRNLTQRVLKKAGYKVKIATNGMEAVDVFKHYKDEISLVLLDVVMPKLGGKEAYEQIKEIEPRVRVLFTSGYASNANQVKSIQETNMELLQKPYTPDILLRKVREVLDKVR